MAASSEKRKFLQSMRSDIRWGGGGSGNFRIPAEIMDRITKTHRRDRVLHLCPDLRDYLTRIALEGLSAAKGGADLADIAVKYGVLCSANFHIDYAVINHVKIAEFNGFSGNKYIRTVQQAISFCTVLGYISRFGQATCSARIAPAIYS